MSEFKGTPGPWQFKYSEKYDTDRGSFTGKDGMQVCWFGDSETYYPTDGTEPSREDIALISAAPELLSALDLILSYHDDGNCVLHREDVSRARAAIKKALGQ